MIVLVLGIGEIIREIVFGETKSVYGSVTEEYARGIAEAIAEELRKRGIEVTPEDIMRSPHFQEMVNKWFRNWAAAFVGEEFLKKLESEHKKTTIPTRTTARKGKVTAQAIDLMEGARELARLVADTVLSILSI